ncbi:MAG: hypothetical protein E6Q97_29515 [Desulfurellales bacterium]|nr:MAG: hypothetical protein E6Q97_29515 [Desulfurellales bacterium]
MADDDGVYEREDVLDRPHDDDAAQDADLGAARPTPPDLASADFSFSTIPAASNGVAGSETSKRIGLG